MMDPALIVAGKVFLVALGFALAMWSLTRIDKAQTEDRESLHRAMYPERYQDVIHADDAQRDFKPEWQTKSRPVGSAGWGS